MLILPCQVCIIWCMEHQQQKAVGYIRVSTEEQADEGVSLAAQAERIKSYCALRGLDLRKIYADKGVSAFTPIAKRPSGANLCEIQGVQHVVTCKLDRLFRNTLDALTTENQWRAAGIALHLVDEGGNSINTHTATGKLMFGVLAGMAQFQRDQISDNTKKAMQHLRENGLPVNGNVRYWESSPGVPDPAKEARVQKIVAARDAGVTLQAIADKLNAAGHATSAGKAWSPKAVSRVEKQYREFSAT